MLGPFEAVLKKKLKNQNQIFFFFLILMKFFLEKLKN